MKIQQLKTNQEILVDFIQLENPPLNIYISDDFCTKGRMLLSEFISNELKMADNLENLNLSISHTNKIGAVLCTAPSIDTVGGVDVADVDVIGLDIEEAHRITEKLVQRIANSSEFELFKNEDWKYIWPIKEAAFKAFYRYQKFNFHHLEEPLKLEDINTTSAANAANVTALKTISEIHIKNVSYSKENHLVTTVNSQGHNIAHGLAFPFKDFLIAVAWISKNK